MTSQSNLDGRAWLSKGVLRPAAWFALAYLGYWLAIAIEPVLVQCVAYPLMGMSVTEWTLTPWRARIANIIPGDLGLGFAVPVALPLVVELVFLCVLARWGARFRPAFLRLVFHFAGAWVVFKLAAQAATLAYWGRLRLGQFSVQLSVFSPGRTALRIAAALAAAVILLAFGVMCARRLTAELRGSMLAREGSAWPAALLLFLPVVLIFAAAFGFQFRFFGPRALLYLLVPAGFWLLIVLMAVPTKRESLPIQIQGTPIGNAGAFVALGVAVALYAGLQQTPRLQSWLVERHFEAIPSEHYRILYDPKAYSAEAVRAFATDRERILAASASRLAVPLGTVRLRVVLYPDPGSLRAATGTERLYRVDGTDIRAVFGKFHEEVDPAADAAALLNATWGPPGSARMGEWLARWLAGQWRGYSLDLWAGQIEREVGHYTLAQLAGSGSFEDLISPLVRQPLSAAWIGTVFNRGGLAAVRKLYDAKPSELKLAGLARLLGTTPDQLEQDWQQWTARRTTPAADPEAPRTSRADTGFFFRGISFSHEGWGGRGDGYVSPEAGAQLWRFREIGANAIAVVPYGFTRGTRDDAFSYAETDETDEELTHALRVAHSLGMRVMLKPQLWVSRGEFTGTIQFDDPAARANWMRNYREFILHYARLAELEQFDVLSIGTELEGLTAHADDWRRLITDVRRVYRGPITYAANWGREFESLDFWDALDFAGVNNYYPLAASPSARVEDLLPGAERLADRLEAVSLKWHKPILFTEVGYPSVQGGSSEPWNEDARRPLGLEEQAAAYEATFRAFARRPWFRGMFWWKWPSSGRGGGPRDTSYTPMGKPAEQVLRAWFTRLTGNSTTAGTPAP